MMLTLGWTRGFGSGSTVVWQEILLLMVLATQRYECPGVSLAGSNLGTDAE